MANEFEIKGLDGVLQKMRTLSPKLQKTGLVRAVRKGANIVRDDARNRAKQFDDPETQNRIWERIVVRQSGRRSKQVGGVVMRVGVLGGASEEGLQTSKRGGSRSSNKSNDSGSNTWYWRLLEFGTSKMAARPFMRPALASNVETATDAIVAELKRQLDEVL